MTFTDEPLRKGPVVGMKDSCSRERVGVVYRFMSLQEDTNRVGDYDSTLGGSLSRVLL